MGWRPSRVRWRPSLLGLSFSFRLSLSLGRLIALLSVARVKLGASFWLPLSCDKQPALWLAHGVLSRNHIKPSLRRMPKHCRRRVRMPGLAGRLCEELHDLLRCTVQLHHIDFSTTKHHPVPPRNLVTRREQLLVMASNLLALASNLVASSY